MKSSIVSPTEILFVVGNDTISQVFDYVADIKIVGTENIDGYDVFINNDYYGTDISTIQINTNDVLKFTITKTNINQESKILLYGILI